MKHKLLFITLIFTTELLAQNPRFLIPYRNGSKWGFCDTLGKIVIEPKYQKTNFFEFNEQTKNPVAKVIINDTSFLFIDSAGKKVLPLQINKAVELKLIGEKVFFVIKDHKTRKLGLQIENKLVVEQILDSLICYQEFDNSIIISKKNKYGLINGRGDIIIPIEFDRITYSLLHTNDSKIVWYGIKGSSKAKFEQPNNGSFDYKISKENKYALYDLKDEGDIEAIEKEKAQELKRNPPNAFIPSVPLKKIEAEVVVLDTKKHLTFYDSLVLLRDSLKKALALDSIRIFENDKKFFYVEKSGKQGIIDDSLGVYFLNSRYNLTMVYFNSRNSWLFNKYQSLVIFVYKQNENFGVTNEFEDTILPPIYTSFYRVNVKEMGLQYTNRFGHSQRSLLNYNSLFKPIISNCHKLDYVKSFYEFHQEKKVKKEFKIYAGFDHKLNNSPNKGKYFVEYLKGFIGENGVEYFKN